jgi:hypothetical protein
MNRSVLVLVLVSLLGNPPPVVAQHADIVIDIAKQASLDPNPIAAFAWELSRANGLRVSGEEIRAVGDELRATGVFAELLKTVDVLTVSDGRVDLQRSGSPLILDLPGYTLRLGDRVAFKAAHADDFGSWLDRVREADAARTLRGEPPRYSEAERRDEALMKREHAALAIGRLDRLIKNGDDWEFDPARGWTALSLKGIDVGYGSLLLQPLTILVAGQVGDVPRLHLRVKILGVNRWLTQDLPALSGLSSANPSGSAGGLRGVLEGLGN